MVDASPELSTPPPGPTATTTPTGSNRSLVEDGRGTAVTDVWAPYRATGLKLTVSIEIAPQGPSKEGTGATVRDSGVPSVNLRDSRPRGSVGRSEYVDIHRRCVSNDTRKSRVFDRGSRRGGEGRRGGTEDDKETKDSGLWKDKLFRRSRAVSEGLGKPQGCGMKGGWQLKSSERHEPTGSNEPAARKTVVIDDNFNISHEGKVEREKRRSGSCLAFQAEEGSSKAWESRKSASEAQHDLLGFPCGPDGLAQCPSYSAGSRTSDLGGFDVFGNETVREEEFLNQIWLCRNSECIESRCRSFPSEEKKTGPPKDEIVRAAKEPGVTCTESPLTDIFSGLKAWRNFRETNSAAESFR